MYDPTYSRYQYLPLKKDSTYRRYRQEERSIESHSLNPVDLDIPAHGTYGALLFDPRWKTKRVEILVRDMHSCTICQSQDTLQVHHRQYHFLVKENKFRMPWDYPDHLLITLCESCHKRGHSKYKVPTINL